MEFLSAGLLDFFRRPSTLVELLTILMLISVAGAFASRVRRHVAQDRAGLPVDGLRRLAFPCTGIGLLALLNFAAHHFGWPLHFVGVAIQLLATLAGVRIAVFALRRVFPDSIAAPGIERFFVGLIWAGFALDLVGILPELIGWLDTFVIHIGKVRVTLWEILQALVSVLGTVIVALWIGGIIEGRLMQMSAIDSSTKAVVSRLTRAALLLGAILVGMSLVGMDITTLSVFSGALGVGLGFGMQKIASNYVSGFIILMDKSIQIGHVIQVGQDRGEVQQITTRYTVLRAPSGLHVIVPNETLIGSTVLNETFVEPRQRGVVRVQVSYSSDIDRAIAILEELAAAEERVLKDPGATAFLVSLDDNGVALELGFWIGDPQKGHLDIRSRINRAILKRFAEEGIEIPYPQREVRVTTAQMALLEEASRMQPQT